MVGAAADLQAQLIASQSMLRGLQQIYTSSNSRVRQMQAQVDELQSQLGKLGGKDVNVTDGPQTFGRKVNCILRSGSCL